MTPADMMKPRRTAVRTLLLIVLMISLPSYAHEKRDQAAAGQIEKLEKPLYNPFVERYLLDEVRTLRTQIQAQRTYFTEKLAHAQLENADRNINYATSTVNNIFYIIAAAASIFALVGWNSIRDIRNKVNEMMDAKVVKISEEYEKRLHTMEQKLKDRTERIISTQEEISRTNTIHSLWMRAGLEVTPQAKIEVYDQILELNSEDIEALTYKADAVLDLDESEWALNLCDKALALNPDYAYAYYQRACAQSILGHTDSALEDLKQAVSLSTTYLDEARTDKSLENIRKLGVLDDMLSNLT